MLVSSLSEVEGSVEMVDRGSRLLADMSLTFILVRPATARLGLFSLLVVGRDT
jgi:hypothetical protein